MRKLLQNIPALLLALTLIICPLAEALAAEASATASTVQLSRTEGTVSVTNSGGKALTQIADMRLYNGNKVATEAESYAWLMLDSTKLNKLDAVSEAELRRDGKKLEVLLNKGNLFFNVTKPLEDQETLNIRTSTMVVGIRGTCGWVKVVDAYNTLVYVLEGTVWCTVTDPISGQSKTTALSGGESARFTVYDQDRDGDKCDIIREKFTEADIDGFVLAELVGDDPMCEKIYEDSGLDLRDLTEKDVQERLERDQAETAEKLRELEELAAGQDRNISRDPVWTEKGDPVESPRDTGDGSASGTTPPASNIVRLTMPVTDMEVQQALNRAGVDQVIVSPGTDPARNTLEIGINMDVAAGKTLTLERGVPAEVRGGLNVDGTADLRDKLENTAGTVTVNSANTLRVGEDLVNRSVLRITAVGRAVVEGALSSTGSLDLTQGARVLARGFALNPGAEGWSVSETANGEGYYTLDYTGTVTPPAPPEPEPVTVERGDFKVTSTGEEYAYADHVLTITGATPVTISMADGVTQTTTDSIFVADGVSADITLDGVKIDLSSTGGTPLDIETNSQGNVTITLADGTTNNLTSGSTCPGLGKSSDLENVGTLLIQGNGALTARATGYASADAGAISGAGIGAIAGFDTRNITITGGMITAEGGLDSAGIGGALQGYAHNIVISGGTIHATGGGSLAAGIGGGCGAAASVTISGGTVTASSIGEGSVISGALDGDITVSGGTVNADIFGHNGTFTMTGGTINGDITSEQSNFTMSGGTINGTLTASTLGEIHLNGGEIVSDKDYTISVPSAGFYLPLYVDGGTVTNTNPTGTAILLGSELNYTSGSIRGMNANLLDRMDGFRAVRQSDYYYYLVPDTGDFAVAGGTAGIDYRFARDESNLGTLTVLRNTPLTISMETPGATTTTDRIFVRDGVDADITLDGVKIDVSGTGRAAAFEIAENSTGEITVTLAGDNLLSSGLDRAGLEYSNGQGSLAINGEGSLHACGICGAGIGGGYNKKGQNITILNGKLSLESKEDSPGNSFMGGAIGGGAQGDSENITISGGMVEDIGGSGIGTSFGGSAKNIVFSGGTINANCVTPQYGQAPEDITITGGVINGTLVAGKIIMTNGTVNGQISTSNFTMTGGEIISGSDVQYAVKITRNDSIHLDGGTITSNFEGDVGGAIWLSYQTELNTIGTVIRGKNSTALLYSPSAENLLDGIPYLLNGYELKGPKGDGYYYLEKIQNP